MTRKYKYGIIFAYAIIALIKHVVTEQCETNYARQSKKCPIPVEEFSPPDNGMLLEKGACIGINYNKGVVPVTKGILENNGTTEDEVIRRGGKCKKLKKSVKCSLPYTSVYTRINHHVVREINDQQKTITMDIQQYVF